jgi:hypothetical protein
MTIVEITGGMLRAARSLIGLSQQGEKAKGHGKEKGAARR